MTRIIGGLARSLSLTVPAAGTRPTSDRVRESLFGALESLGLPEDAAVLDLFAGSGALGLEAASRGATRVDLVEHARTAAQIAIRNAERVAKAGAVRAQVHTSTVNTFLRNATADWDVVFLDPPYDVTDAELNETLTLLSPHLNEDALVIVERQKRSAQPDWETAGLEPYRDRAYGDTTLWWGQPRPTPASA